jgi:hypothetical protein
MVKSHIRAAKVRFADLDPDILEDPLKFVSFMWPDIRLYSKQAEILESLRYNYETTVHAANEVGKDFVASLAVVWFFASRAPARVITSSSGETQLKSILWTEINQRLSTARYDLGWRVTDLHIDRHINGKPDELSYVIGHVTKVIENFQGHHLPHDIPRVLCVFDECSAIGDAFHEAAESWAHRILNIGNPMNNQNYFYRTRKKGNIADPTGENDLLSNVIRIDAKDTPNVQLGVELEKAGLPGPYPNVIPGVVSYEEYVRRSMKWDKPKRVRRLDGEFYEGEESLWFPMLWLDQAELAFRLLAPKGYSIDMPRISGAGKILSMGVDCGAGRDLSVWTVIDRLGIVCQETLVTPDTFEISTKTKELLRRFNIQKERVCFDAGGGGKQIVDYMRRHGFPTLRAVSFGSSPTPPVTQKTKQTGQKIDKQELAWVWKNKRAEMYGILRQWLDPSINENVFGIPEELYLLREELAPLPMWFDRDGKAFLPPKDHQPGKQESPNELTLKKLLGRSPDRADSLVLAVYALASNARTTIGAIRR